MINHIKLPYLIIISAIVIIYYSLFIKLQRDLFKLNLTMISIEHFFFKTLPAICNATDYQGNRLLIYFTVVLNTIVYNFMI